SGCWVWRPPASAVGRKSRAARTGSGTLAQLGEQFRKFPEHRDVPVVRKLTQLRLGDQGGGVSAVRDRYDGVLQAVHDEEGSGHGGRIEVPGSALDPGVLGVPADPLSERLLGGGGQPRDVVLREQLSVRLRSGGTAPGQPGPVLTEGTYGPFPGGVPVGQAHQGALVLGVALPR